LSFGFAFPGVIGEKRDKFFFFLVHPIAESTYGWTKKKKKSPQDAVNLSKMNPKLRFLTQGYAFMTKKDPKFTQAKSDVIENLEALQMSLDRCVDEGMIDYESKYYNELSDLVDDTHIVKTWEELREVITLAKTIEMDLDSWVSLRGGSSMSLGWPEREPIN
jgi:hypothetical protein